MIKKIKWNGLPTVLGINMGIERKKT